MRNAAQIFFRWHANPDRREIATRRIRRLVENAGGLYDLGAYPPWVIVPLDAEERIRAGIDRILE